MQRAPLLILQLYGDPMINYDLYDLHAMIVFFRSRPERFEAYKSAVEGIIALLSDDAPTDDNIIRRTLLPCYSDSDTALSWVTVNNRYTAGTTIIKDRYVRDTLAAVLTEMTACNEDKERFCALCEAVHNIPLILADEKDPRRTVRSMIKDYRKYNRSFLE